MSVIYVSSDPFRPSLEHCLHGPPFPEPCAFLPQDECSNFQSQEDNDLVSPVAFWTCTIWRLLALCLASHATIYGALDAPALSSW